MKLPSILHLWGSNPCSLSYLQSRFALGRIIATLTIKQCLLTFGIQLTFAHLSLSGSEAPQKGAADLESFSKSTSYSSLSMTRGSSFSDCPWAGLQNFECAEWVLITRGCAAEQNMMGLKLDQTHS